MLMNIKRERGRIVRKKWKKKTEDISTHPTMQEGN